MSTNINEQGTGSNLNNNLTFSKTFRILQNLNFGKRYNESLLNNLSLGINEETQNRFIQNMIFSSTQIPLSREIKKQKMQNDKETISINSSNTTLFPLSHYNREIRNLNITSDSTYGGHNIERDEEAINIFRNLTLKPTTTNDSSLDKLRTRKYTKYLYQIISSLNDYNKVHFTKETICYILYAFLYQQPQLDRQQFSNQLIHLYFHDHLHEIGEHPLDDEFYVINASDSIEIAHAIRAILLTNDCYRLSRNHPINIYIPTPFIKYFDPQFELDRQSKIIEVQAQILHSQCLSWINGTYAHLGRQANERLNLEAIEQVLPDLTPLQNPFSFTVDIHDFHSAMSVLSRSWGVLYFNGRCYDGNLNACGALTRNAAHVILVSSDLKLRIAFVHKLIHYAAEKDIVLYRKSRILNKLCWYTRNRFIMISIYLKRFLGSLLESTVRNELGSDYRMFLDIAEIIGDQFFDVKLRSNNNDETFNLLSCARNPINIHCDLSDHMAYTYSPQHIVNEGINRSRAWFGDIQMNNDIPSVNIHIQDKSYNHQPMNPGDFTSELLLVEYCNSITNWNELLFGTYEISKKIDKYHFQPNSHKQWNYNTWYYLENGLSGQYEIYGINGHMNLRIHVYANNLNFDCNAFCIPYIYEYPDDPDNHTTHVRFYVKDQPYITIHNSHLYHPSGDSVTGLFKPIVRQNFVF